MAAPSDPIDRVSAFSTGHARVRPEHIGPTRKPFPVWLWTSRRWTDPLPVNVFVVEHRNGLVLFDTGYDRAAVTDPGYYPTRMDRAVNARMGQVELPEDQTMESGLSRLGHAVADVHTAVLSHLHPDHVGGLPRLHHATVVVSADEWASLQRPMPETRGMYRSHIDLPGLTWNRIVPEPLGDATLAPFTDGHDLFGDGSLVLLPTPGHTAGSLSLLIRRPDHAPLLLVGDLTYDLDLFEAGELSGMCKRAQTRGVMADVKALRDGLPDLVILPSHDRRSAEHLAKATAG